MSQKKTSTQSASPNLRFEMSLAEANLVFKALGKLPFAEVYELIGKLNAQANQQLRQSPLEAVLGDEGEEMPED